MKKYVVINIGCLECGYGSELVGVYNTQEEADAAVEKTNEECDSHGQYSAQSFEIEV